jgi:hypothetical protein
MEAVSEAIRPGASACDFVVHVDDPTGAIHAGFPLGTAVRLDEHGIVTSLGGRTAVSSPAQRLLGRPYFRTILPAADVGALEEQYRAGVGEGLASIMFGVRFRLRDRSPLVTVALFYSVRLGCGWAFAREGKS